MSAARGANRMLSRLSGVSLGMVFILLAGWVQADEATDQRLQIDEQRILARLAEASAAGGSGILHITYGGEIVLESGFGSANCESEENIGGDHLFMIGSITKELTRVLGFVLEEQGFLSLEDTVADWIPGFTGPIGAVKLIDIINHAGGLPDLIDRVGQPVAYRVAYDYRPTTREQLIDSANLAALIFKPGTKEEYSNLGYQLLAAVYEYSAGTAYAELLDKFIYQPAHMQDTGYWFADIGARHFANGCDINGAHWGNPIEDRMWPAAGPSWNLLGAGGLLSTAASLAKFFEGIGTGVYFEDPETAGKYKQSRLKFSLRWQQPVMGPGGSNGIFNAVSFWADDDRLSVTLMTNRASYPAEGGLIRDVLALISVRAANPTALNP